MGSEWVTNIDFGWAGEIFKARSTAKMQEALNYYVDFLITEMQKPKSGRTYYSPNVPGGKWVASSASEYPAVKTGALTEALAEPGNWKVEFENQQSLVAFIELPESVLSYADDILEKDGLRPWANRSLIECSDAIQEILGPNLVTDINEALEKGITEFGARSRRRNS